MKLKLKLNKMIHPESKFIIYWDIIILLSSVFIAIEIPLIIVFNLTEGVFLVILNWIVTAIYITDIIVNFNTSIYTKGKIISDRKYIAKRYLKRWVSTGSIRLKRI